MVCLSRGAIARSGATTQSGTAQDGLDCVASLAVTETGIGSWRRDLVLGRALAAPCPAWQGDIPVVGVAIQPVACILAVINRRPTRILASPSIHDSGDFPKNLWRRSALRLRSGRGERRLERQFRREAFGNLARRRTIGRRRHLDPIPVPLQDSAPDPA